MNLRTSLTLSAAALAALGCTSPPGPAQLDAQAQAMHRASFRDQGIAKVDRLKQDHVQQACSSDQPPSAALAKQLEAESLATVKWPSGGVYLGDWRAGEKLAQKGRGMSWNDSSTKTSANGGMCYNCHELSKAEISYGTIGPSLYNYGKVRGVKDPLAPASAAIVQYTWGKLWNSKAYTACSDMPRFGHMGLLDEDQLRDLMALLLDPESPVNK